MRVLIIEPDHILAREYQKAFTKAKVESEICYDAQQAVLSIDSNRPDVVVLELQLAGHSGVEFMHEFRSYEDWTNIPVIIHSSIPEYALGVDKKIWKSLGVVRYFYKPKTSMQQLVGAVKSTIDGI